MANAANLLNNTILIPYHDGLTSGKGNQLEDITLTSQLSALEGTDWDKDNIYSAYLKLNDGSSVKLIALAGIDGFGMEREFEQRYGDSSEYTVNLPGAVKFSNVGIKHLYTRDSMFLDWLLSGTMQGGASTADLEIHIHPKKKKKMVFTCYDAFPVEWSLDPLRNSEDADVLYESVSLAFSRIDIKLENK